MHYKWLFILGFLSSCNNSDIGRQTSGAKGSVGSFAVTTTASPPAETTPSVAMLPSDGTTWYRLCAESKCSLRCSFPDRDPFFGRIYTMNICLSGDEEKRNNMAREYCEALGTLFEIPDITVGSLSCEPRYN